MTATGTFVFWGFPVAVSALMLHIQNSERCQYLLKTVFECYYPLAKSTVRRETRPGVGVCTDVVMREMLHPSSEEGRRIPSTGCCPWGWLQWHHSQRPEENASTHFPKPTNPKGSQVFLTCCLCFTPVWNSAKKGNVSVPDGNVYHELRVRNQSGWVRFKTSYSKVWFNQYKILWYHP